MIQELLTELQEEHFQEKYIENDNARYYGEYTQKDEEVGIYVEFSGVKYPDKYSNIITDLTFDNIEVYLAWDGAEMYVSEEEMEEIKLKLEEVIILE